MIVADAKPISEIFGFIADCRKVLILGCNACVAVCQVGGEKEVGVLAQALRLKARQEGKQIEFLENAVQRQCEPEFVDPILADLGDVEAVVTIACGVGANFLVDRKCPIPVYPGVNTTHLGACVEHGVWEERCAGCGNCILNNTGGICPVARCAKTIMNGPCGGTKDGMCEVSSPENPVPCAWYLIVERLTKLGQLDRLSHIEPARTWSTGRDGGPRRRVREDLRLKKEEQGAETAEAKA